MFRAEKWEHNVCINLVLCPRAQEFYENGFCIKETFADTAGADLSGESTEIAVVVTKSI